MDLEDSCELSPGTLSRQSADSTPTVATWTTEPDDSVPDVTADDGSAVSSASLSARREQYVLVTGGLGFIGSHTAVELLKSGFNVIIVDDLSNSFRSVLDGILEIGRRYYCEASGPRGHGTCPMVEMHQISYRDLPAMRSILELHSFPSPTGEIVRSNIVGVVHLAAYKAVEESVRHPLRYYQNNVNGLVDLMALLDEFGVKTFIFSSSAAVYGSLSHRARPLREENCIHPCEMAREPAGAEQPPPPPPQSSCAVIANPYGRTKLFAEAILSDLVASDPSWNVVVLRYFNPVGCDDSGLLADNPRGTPSSLVPVVTQVMTGQRPRVQVYGGDWDTADGTAVRDFIHVSDLARGHTAALLACRDGRVAGSYRTYNLGTGAGHSVLDVVRAMEAVSGRPIPRAVVARRPGDVASSVAAVDRARRELCWETKRTLLDACQSVCGRLKLLRAGSAA
ncbi:UDP-glucose 4-epimerase [Metarhizium album ARSEF 1941]|uniref:UDP-glucose 4-epimerase n=1 Tax=Metarhizium album (strain ARSEF 1941) TaxID=1081103 RepID=A0A0B2WNB9_METAS|nr:UDP-glucose 4-epimerase [Metarhizium album ARSEF 1941]KHN97556.1 UDP-glucose 4-epimerase [Metarhizium album ARSEF 1941]